MSGLAVAAVLSGSILLASMFSVELALSVAIVELAAGFVVGNAFSITPPDWLTYHRDVRGRRAVLPRGRRGGHAAAPA